jgi:hypothetical protein
MGKIQESTNYDKFEMLSFNRDVHKTSYLELSMRKHGWIDAYPAHVVPNGNGKLKIKAGHNRFFVARKLGIPIKFVVCGDNATIFELEKATTKWTLKDYLISFIRSGYSDYQVVDNYAKKTGINLGQCISLLAGESASSSNWESRFKAGTFRLGDPLHATIVADIIILCKTLGVTIATNFLFVQAVSKIVWPAEFSLSQMKDRIINHKELIQKQPTQKDYITMLDTIYNYKSRTKIPLAFLAEQAAKERNPAGKPL